MSKAVKQMSFLNNQQKTEANQGVMNQRRYILNDKCGFSVQEAYKTLRTNIRFYLPGEQCKKFCVTSGLAGEGKTITTLNLAISFAQAGHRVLLIDADMRRPTLHRLLIEKSSPGLSNVLAGFTSELEAIRKEVYPNLDMLFAGDTPPNPSELLLGSEMKKVIERLSARYDYILIDTPPVGLVSDACVVANLLDGVLFVVRENVAEKEAVRKGIKQMELAGCKIMGFVLNGVEDNNKKRKRYYKRYTYYRL